MCTNEYTVHIDDYEHSSATMFNQRSEVVHVLVNMAVSIPRHYYTLRACRAVMCLLWFFEIKINIDFLEKLVGLWDWGR